MSNPTYRLLPLVVLVALVACGDDDGAASDASTPPDGVIFDAPGMDGSAFDAPGMDGSALDAAGFDAAGFDAAGFDAAGFDAAGSDGSAVDASLPDVGMDASVTPNAIYFGALTRMGEGGWPLPAGATGISDAGATGLVSDGTHVFPGRDGVTAGQIVLSGTGDTLEVITGPDTFSCRSFGELNSTLPMTRYGVHTIWMREGQEYTTVFRGAPQHVIQGRPAGSPSSSAHVMVMGHPNESAFLFNRLRISVPGIALGSGIIGAATEDATTSAGNPEVLLLDQAHYFLADGFRIENPNPTYATSRGRITGEETGGRWMYRKGIRSTGSDDVIIRNTEIFDTTDGITVGGLDWLIEDTEIRHWVSNGMFWNECTGLTIRRTLITDAARGHFKLTIASGSNFQVRNGNKIVIRVNEDLSGFFGPQYANSGEPATLVGVAGMNPAYHQNRALRQVSVDSSGSVGTHTITLETVNGSAASFSGFNPRGGEVWVSNASHPDGAQAQQSSRIVSDGDQDDVTLDRVVMLRGQAVPYLLFGQGNHNGGGPVRRNWSVTASVFVTDNVVLRIAGLESGLIAGNILIGQPGHPSTLTNFGVPVDPIGHTSAVVYQDNVLNYWSARHPAGATYDNNLARRFSNANAAVIDSSDRAMITELFMNPPTTAEFDVPSARVAWEWFTGNPAGPTFVRNNPSLSHDVGFANCSWGSGYNDPRR